MNPELFKVLQNLHQQRAAIAEFVAPYGGNNCTITIWTEGVLQAFKFRSKQFGWGLFKVVPTRNKVKLEREADEIEIATYLDHEKSFKLIIAEKADKNAYFAFPYNSESFFKAHKTKLPIVVQLCQGVKPFDVINAVNIGTFLFKEVDYSQPTDIQDYLTRNLTEYVAPEKNKFPGLSPEYKLAYELAYAMNEELNPAKKDETRLKREVSRLGGKLVSFRDHGKYWTVEWQAPCEIGTKEKQTSRVEKDFSINSAGFCVSGDDRKFDLASIVGVRQRLKGNNPYW